MKKIKDPFGFSKAINYEKLNDPKVLEALSNMFDNKKEKIDFKDLKKNDRIKSNQIGTPITGKLMESPKQGKGLKKVVLIWTNGSEIGMFDEHGSIYANQITEVERDGTWLEVNHG